MDNQSSIPQWLLDIEERAKKEAEPSVFDAILGKHRSCTFVSQDIPRLVEALKEAYTLMDKLERKAVKLQDSELCDKVRLEVSQFRRKYGDHHAQV
jgi:hypothetical protein